jgi:hypothetical protein
VLKVGKFKLISELCKKLEKIKFNELHVSISFMCQDLYLFSVIKYNMKFMFESKYVYNDDNFTNFV